MASPSTPTHGKFGMIYALRPGGFNGVGLNDVTWGTGYSAADSGYFEVVIDSELGGTLDVDTFKWRKDGGEWTENVDITGSAQTLSDSQTVTFAATTGHTLTDQWAIGNLFAEPCTESTIYGQITDTGLRILNPNSPPTFTDDGGETVLQISYTEGKATFTGNVGAVTVAGNNGVIIPSTLQKMGYLYEWSLNPSVDIQPAPRMQQSWVEHIIGQAGASGSAAAYFLSSNSFLDSLITDITDERKYFFLQLFNYDPDDDQTGDHFNCWASFENVNVGAPVGEVVKEAMSFKIYGQPSFSANA